MVYGREFDKQFGDIIGFCIRYIKYIIVGGICFLLGVLVS